MYRKTEYQFPKNTFFYLKNHDFWPFRIWVTRTTDRSIELIYKYKCHTFISGLSVLLLNDVKSYSKNSACPWNTFTINAIGIISKVNHKRLLLKLLSKTWIKNLGKGVLFEYRNRFLRHPKGQSPKVCELSLFLRKLFSKLHKHLPLSIGIQPLLSPPDEHFRKFGFRCRRSSIHS